MIARLRSWWQQIQKYRKAIGVAALVFLVAIVIALSIAVVLSNGTGFNGYTIKSTATETTLSPQTKVTTTEQSQSGKTLWDWLQLLIVPLVLAIGGFWFSQMQKTTEQRSTTDNQREAALQAYINEMSELLLHEKLRESAGDDEVRTIARVRTLTVLRGLDATRKASVIQFLHASGLIDKDTCIISLYEADLRRATLSYATLHRATLSEADLTGADLSYADLTGADLSYATLRHATLRHATLIGALLRNADLSYVTLSYVTLSGATLSDADLFEADLTGADLSNADLTGATLIDANLSDADLSGAKVTEEQLKETKSLKDTTMRDGSKHS
jgi:uncharacterized protein YjbI with pentapeptide repeats